MTESIITGFLLGSSLIIAIGAQNIFVLRQGIMRQHIFITSLYCSISDTILIFLGIVGVSIFFDNFIYKYSDFLFVFSAIWLFSYGLIRFFSAIKSNSSFSIESEKKKDIFSTLSMLTVLTFANPHVYLDTLFLIGSVSTQFEGQRIYFAFGAMAASFAFFFLLGYGSRRLTPVFAKPVAWRYFNAVIGLTMVTIAASLIL